MNEDLIINPATGTVTDMDSIDSLISSYAEAKAVIDDLRAFELALRHRMWELTSGTTKTRRIEGDQYAAKVVEGAKGVSQSILKEVWNAFPEIADKYMRISSLSLNLREVKKLQSTVTDSDRLGLVKQMIADAMDRGHESPPTISIERGPDKD